MSNVYPFAIAFVVSALGAYPIYRLLLALKSRQTVSQFLEGHQKKQGTPTMGGLIVALGFLSVQGWHVFQSARTEDHFNLQAEVAMFALFLGFSIIGFVDDYVVPRMIAGKRGLGWKQKILMQLAVAAACASVMGGGFSKKFFVVVFLILFFSNAFNFSDGLDWLAGLLLLGLAGGLLLIARATGEHGLQVYLLALLGSVLPFLYLNRPKAKVFMGDVGSLPIGAVLGAVVAMIALPGFLPQVSPLWMRYKESNIHFGHDVYQTLKATPATLLSLFVISGMMIVELVPVPLQILSVKLRKRKLFSFTPIHHAFERKGWPEFKVVIVFAGCQLILSLIAIGIVKTQPHGAAPVKNSSTPILRPSASSAVKRLGGTQAQTILRLQLLRGINRSRGMVRARAPGITHHDGDRDS